MWLGIVRLHRPMLASRVRTQVGFAVSVSAVRGWQHMEAATASLRSRFCLLGHRLGFLACGRPWVCA